PDQPADLALEDDRGAVGSLRAEAAGASADALVQPEQDERRGSARLLSLRQEPRRTRQTRARLRAARRGAENAVRRVRSATAEEVAIDQGGRHVGSFD